MSCSLESYLLLIRKTGAERTCCVITHTLGKKTSVGGTPDPSTLATELTKGDSLIQRPVCIRKLPISSILSATEKTQLDQIRRIESKLLATVNRSIKPLFSPSVVRAKPTRPVSTAPVIEAGS